MNRVAQYVIDKVVGHTYMSAQKKLSEEFDTRQIIPQDVARCASSLEATAIMIDKAPGDAPVQVHLTRDELIAFVCYMRQLDIDYRVLNNELEVARGQIKNFEEAEKSRASVYKPTSPRAGHTSRHEDEFADISSRQLQILEKTARIRQALKK